MRLPRTHAWVCLVVLTSFGLGPALADQPADIQAALDAGAWDQARTLLPASPELADPWLGRIALAQFHAGDAASAGDTLRRIHSPGELSRAANSIAQQAQGGASGADFDSLINLITATVAPDSWDEVGGPGTVQSFPGGRSSRRAGRLAKRTPSAQARSLDVLRDATRLAGQHDDAHQASPLRMVSLPRLERELKICLALGEQPNEVMTHLAGLYEIRYLFLFPESRDVVIAGPAAGWTDDEYGRAVTQTGRPTLLLDDLVNLLRNAREQQGKFGCSIDPHRQRLAATQAFLAQPTGTLKPWQTKKWVNQIRETLGWQEVRVYGVSPQSHVARVLVEADYHMKLIGMGLEPSVDGLPSYLDLIKRDSIPQAMDVLRWWFTLRPQVVAGNASGDAFQLAREVIQLQCENERVSTRGQREQTNAASPLNQEFANRFTQRIGQLRREYSVYAELDNLFRMALIAGLLHQEQVLSQVDWDANWLIESLRPAQRTAPREVQSIVNHRVIGGRHVVVGVSGGVTVEVAAHVRRPRELRDPATLHSQRSAANQQIDLASEVWWWD